MPGTHCSILAGAQAQNSICVSKNLYLQENFSANLPTSSLIYPGGGEKYPHNKLFIENEEWPENYSASCGSSDNGQEQPSEGAHPTQHRTMLMWKFL